VLGHFLARKHIPKFTQHLKAGRYLLVVHGSEDEVRRAQEILQTTGATDVTVSDMSTAA
jgi:hypothetical protein